MVRLGNPRLVPYRAEHLLLFYHRDASNYSDNVRFSVDKERQGPAFTAVYEDAVLGCAGVQIAWPGHGVAWSVFSPEILKWPVWLTRTCRNALRDIIRSHNLRRVEMVAIAEDDNAIKWAYALGFVVENGRAHRYTHSGEDVVRFELLGGT